MDVKVFLKKRREGKTTELVKMSAETQTYILTLNRIRVEEIVKTANKLGLLIPYPITLEEYYSTKFRGSYIREILIDDADDILREIFNVVKINAITMTKEDEDENS